MKEIIFTPEQNRFVIDIMLAIAFINIGETEIFPVDVSEDTDKKQQILVILAIFDDLEKELAQNNIEVNDVNVTLEEKDGTEDNDGSKFIIKVEKPDIKQSRKLDTRKLVRVSGEFAFPDTE